MSGANPVPLDVYEKDNRIFVRAAVPGVKPEELDITFQEGVLTINGETRHEFETDKDAKVYRREYRYGKFARSIRLPEDIDTEGISAKFENGFVTIEIPKRELPKPEVKKIDVLQAGASKSEKPVLEGGTKEPHMDVATSAPSGP